MAGVAVGANLFEHALTYVALSAATPHRSVPGGHKFREGTPLPEQQPPLAPVKSSVFQTKTQEPELRESTTKYNKIQTYQWEQKTKQGQYRDLPTQLW
jgi:hypothetical protein